MVVFPVDGLNDDQSTMGYSTGLKRLSFTLGYGQSVFSFPTGRLLPICAIKVLVVYIVSFPAPSDSYGCEENTPKTYVTRKTPVN